MGIALAVAEARVGTLDGPPVHYPTTPIAGYAASVAGLRFSGHAASSTTHADTNPALESPRVGVGVVRSSRRATTAGKCSLNARRFGRSIAVYTPCSTQSARRCTCAPIPCAHARRSLMSSRPPVARLVAGGGGFRVGVVESLRGRHAVDALLRAGSRPTLPQTPPTLTRLSRESRYPTVVPAHQRNARVEEAEALG